MEYTGAEIVVKCLQKEHVEHVFGYPGVPYFLFTTRFLSKKIFSTFWLGTNKLLYTQRCLLSVE